MCCKTENSSCKCITFFLGLIVGAIVLGAIALFPDLLTNLALVLSIVLTISAVLAAAAVALSIYAVSGKASQCFIKCFCSIGRMLLMLAVASFVLSLIALWLPLVDLPILAAVFGGVVAGVFTALVISYVCFALCLYNKACGC